MRLETICEADGEVSTCLSYCAQIQIEMENYHLVYVLPDSSVNPVLYH